MCLWVCFQDPEHEWRRLIEETTIEFAGQLRLYADRFPSPSRVVDELLNSITPADYARLFYGSADNVEVSDQQTHQQQQPHPSQQPPQQEQASRPGPSRETRTPLGELNHPLPLRITRVWTRRSMDEEEEENQHPMSSSDVSEGGPSTPHIPAILRSSSRKRRLFPTGRQNDDSSLAEPIPSTSSSQPTTSGASREVTQNSLFV